MWRIQDYKDGKEYIERTYKYSSNDIIKGTYENKEVSIEVGAISKTRPYGMEQTYYGGGYLIVDYEETEIFEFTPRMITMQANNSEKTVEDLKNIDKELNIGNLEKQAKSENAMNLVVSIFLYGFITVITLIGVTNIFNTITSNMELRQKEFAMLKSIGMTKKEFNRMINLETLFYSSKALVYGVSLGILGSYAIYKSIAIKTEKAFEVPYIPIIISCLFVFIIVYIIMRYSINKINKQNTIETIRNENI